MLTKKRNCCDISHQINVADGSKKIVLAGNPNVGKSIFFNDLTGIYVAVSNYPGTTLDINSGTYQDYTIIDTPGVYGVSSFNDEEIVARDVILAADLVVNVVDAVHLERDLFLSQQIIDMGIPVIVVLNMMDEAEKNGIVIDIRKLSEELSVPVIPATAIKGRGLRELKDSISIASTGKSIFIKGELKDKLDDLSRQLGNQAEALMILEGDPHIAAKYDISPLPSREEIYRLRRERVN
ncbi:MAG: FeoB small GTPase domain-containing protein, partial [Halanaerobiales bacterium]